MRSLVLLLGLALANIPSLAGECSIFIDSKDLYTFGGAALGAPKEKLGSIAGKSTSCVENSDGSYYDCEYQDSNGISYLVEGKVVVRKEVRDLLKYRGRLIGGISHGDDLVDVLRKLSSLPDGFPVWSVGFESNGGFIIGTDTCIRASNGVEWSYSIYFDKSGYIISVGAQLNWN